MLAVFRGYCIFKQYKKTGDLMPSCSTILDPYRKTVTLVSNGQSETFPYSAAISCASVADRLSPQVVTLIVNHLARPACKPS